MRAPRWWWPWWPTLPQQPQPQPWRTPPPSHVLTPSGRPLLPASTPPKVACLYPLDTIKVRCQTTSSSAAKVVADMLRANGGPLSPALWRQLYAGAVGASLMSVAVGALYYSSFCAAKRQLLRLTADGEKRAAAAAATAAAADALPPPPGAGALGGQGQQGQQQRQGAAAYHHQPHGPSVDYHHDVSDDAARPGAF